MPASMSAFRRRHSLETAWRLLAALVSLTLHIDAQVQQNLQQNQEAASLFTGTGRDAFYGGQFDNFSSCTSRVSVNLVPFGPENGDLEVSPGFLTGGQTIDLHM